MPLRGPLKELITRPLFLYFIIDVVTLLVIEHIQSNIYLSMNTC